jgi:hypothetical protein
MTRPVGRQQGHSKYANQHSSDERQRQLAAAIGEAARAALLKPETASGTHVARDASNKPRTSGAEWLI